MPRVPVEELLPGFLTISASPISLSLKKADTQISSPEAIFSSFSFKYSPSFSYICFSFCSV